MNTIDNFSESPAENTRKIRELNDLFRATFLGGRVVVTSGISSFPPEEVQVILGRVKAFDNFTPDNDPNEEHDFGGFLLKNGTKIFWKIDYYDQSMTGSSENPAIPEETVRVLTVMLAEEY